MIRLALVLGALVACAHSAPAPATTTPAAATAPDDPSCPVLVPGTSVSVEDTPTGAALVFVTTGNVADVRTRSARLATMHATKAGPTGAMGMMISTPATAEIAEIPAGAKITFTATPDNVAPLQSELHAHARHLAGGTCEMPDQPGMQM